jgi:predicted aconitase
MYLTKEEERMYNGECGELIEWAMKTIVAWGEVFNAKRMVRIDCAHCSCSAYMVDGKKSILDFMGDLAKSKPRVVVPATCQVASTDMVDWKNLNIPEYVAEGQLKLRDIIEGMGPAPTWTCAPYLVGNIPVAGSNIAWCESSAIVYANSVFGARTNRECGQSVWFASFIGRTAEYGLRLDENRRARVLIDVTANLKNETDYGALGYFGGKVAGLRIPAFKGIKKIPTVEDFMQVSAALATTGGVPMFHVLGITPEARRDNEAFGGEKPEETIEFGEEELKKTYERIHSGSGDKVDFVFLGCPHATYHQVKSAAEMLEGKKIKKDTTLWIATARQTRNLIEKAGYGDVIRAAGGKIICDTCPAAALEIGFKPQVMVTNSFKQAHYVPGQFKADSIASDMKSCISAALEGRWRA